MDTTGATKKNNGIGRLHKFFYYVKPLIPRSFQIYLRRLIVARKRRVYLHLWPINPISATPPPGWNGWPNGKKFALILSHDVENRGGLKKARLLADYEKDIGIRSSFNFVPERYPVPDKLRASLEKDGFEIAVHGLVHDGKLYWSRQIFTKRAKKINRYLKQWNAVGFHSPSMHKNLDWIHDLDIIYDQSTFDTDPFEPDPQGLNTIFPLWISHKSKNRGYIELPYTLPQDHTLFIIMQERSIDIWKKKLDWIAKHGGMALLNTHPDYMNFNGTNLGIEEYPASYYLEFLDYVRSEYQGRYWQPLPRELAYFWRKTYHR